MAPKPAALLMLLALPLAAAIWPDQWGTFKRSAPQAVTVPDQPLLDEYGLEDTEQAEYTSGAVHFTATAWRLRDSTGAMALFQARRPSQARPSPLTSLAVTTSDGVLLAYGNYLLQFTGRVPQTAELAEFLDRLPRLERSSLPVLASDLPAEGLIPNSERYIVGPVSLARFGPPIPPSVAAFHLGAEAQLGKYHTKAGDIALTIFNYPTPGMARERVADFRKLPGAMVKRTGPLVAVIFSPSDPDAAERILAKVNYQASVTWNEPNPSQQVRGVALMILAIFKLAGYVLGLCLLGGLGYGAVRVLTSQSARRDAGEPMITLHLSDK